MNNCKCNKNDELRIVRGNAFGMRLTVRAIHADGTEVEDFNLTEANAVLKVVHQGTMTEKAFTIINNDVVINFDGLLALGWYGFEMSGLYNGEPWRWYIEQVFCIVESNARANIPAWAVLTDETYQIGITTSITSGDIYQSDWDEENPTSPAYIWNKPQIYTKAEIDGMMTEVERELDGKQPTIDDLPEIRSGASAGAAAAPQATTYTKAEVDALIANFITKSVNDLVNYYLKSDTYTKTEVQQLIDAVKQFTYQVVTTLPTASADTMNKIYLVPSTNPETQNVKDEYITIDNGTEAETRYTWEQIGSTTIDLSGYYTALQTDAAISSALSTALADYSTTSAMNTAITTAINTALADYSTTNQMNAAIATAIANYYTKAEVDALIANFITKSVNDLVNYYLKSDTYTKAEVQQLIDAVKQFTYQVVTTLPTATADTMNKIYLVPSSNPETQNVKDEYITIDNGIEAQTRYTWEQIGTTSIDLSGYYTSAQTDAAITTALNTALADYSTTSQMTTAIATALASYYTKTEVDTELAKKTDKLPMTGAGAAIENNFMAIDANGNIKDSGKNASDFQLKVTDCAMLGGGYATCSTAGGTAAKTVTISDFLLLPNCRISVLFTNAFTATSPTLSINGDPAIAIMHFGRAMEVGKVHANTVLTMVYDGTYWQVIGIESMAGSAPSGAVDLALPSGLLWCEHNVGAATPYDDGLYFSWGNITGQTGDDGYDFGTSNDGPYASTPGAALTGNIPTNNTYDAARHNMGAPWRMPTVGEFQELNAQCDSEWTDEDGIAGRRFISRINGNSIFFPASGYRYGTALNSRGSNGLYWSASLYSQTYGYDLNFSSGVVNPASHYNRFSGFSVRAVQ